MEIVQTIKNDIIHKNINLLLLEIIFVFTNFIAQFEDFIFTTIATDIEIISTLNTVINILLSSVLHHHDLHAVVSLPAELLKNAHDDVIIIIDVTSCFLSDH